MSIVPPFRAMALAVPPGFNAGRSLVQLPLTSITASGPRLMLRAGSLLAFAAVIRLTVPPGATILPSTLMETLDWMNSEPFTGRLTLVLAGNSTSPSL
jgi:hypothetical protein